MKVCRIEVKAEASDVRDHPAGCDAHDAVRIGQGFGQGAVVQVAGQTEAAIMRVGRRVSIAADKILVGVENRCKKMRIGCPDPLLRARIPAR